MTELSYFDVVIRDFMTKLNKLSGPPAVRDRESEQSKDKAKIDYGVSRRARPERPRRGTERIRCGGRFRNG